MVTRESLKHNIMRSVTIRGIYEGIISIESFLEKEKEFFYSVFTRTFSKQENISNNFLLKLQNTYGLISNIEDLEKQNTQIYKNDNYAGNEISLVINKYYLSLDIKCKEYKNIDPYLDIFFEILRKLKEHEKLMWIKEIGIKKNSSQIYSSLKELFIEFDKDKMIAGEFCSDMLKSTILQKKEIENVMVDISKKIEKGKRMIDDKKEDAYRVQFDFDGEINYLDEMSFDEIEEKTKSLNNILFETFIVNVTENFIKTHSKD